MFWIDVVSRVLHVTTAIVLLGGTLYVTWVLVPALQILNSEARATLVTETRQRWKKIVHGGIAMFLLTGFYNYFKAMPNHKGDGLYHALIGTKILLVLGLFFLASVLVGRSSKFAGMRDNAARWSQLVCLIGIIIVAMSGFLKVSSVVAQ